MAVVEFELGHLAYTVHRLCSTLAWKMPYKVVAIWSVSPSNHTVALVRMPSGHVVRFEEITNASDIRTCIKRLHEPHDFFKTLVFVRQEEGLAGYRWTLSRVGVKPIDPPAVHDQFRGSSRRWASARRARKALS